MVFRRRREKKEVKKITHDEPEISSEPVEIPSEDIPELDEPTEPVSITDEIEPTIEPISEPVVEPVEEEKLEEEPLIDTPPVVESEEVEEEVVSVDDLTEELVKTEEDFAEETFIEDSFEEPPETITTDEIVEPTIDSLEEVVEELEDSIDEIVDDLTSEEVDEVIELPPVEEDAIEEDTSEEELPVMVPITATEDPIEETIKIIEDTDDGLAVPDVPDVDREEPVIEEPVIETVEVTETKEELFTHPDSNVKVSEFLKQKDAVETIEEPEPLEEIELTLKVPKELYDFLKSVLQLFEWSYEDSKQYLNYLLLDSIEEALKNNFGQVPGSEKLTDKLDKIIEDFKKQL